MVVRIRLARHGTTNNPFYHFVAIRGSAKRQGKPIEKLGEYDPRPRPPQSPYGPVQAWQDVSYSSQPKAPTAKDRLKLEAPVFTSGIEHMAKLEKRIEWKVERIRYWLGVGAQPSKPVAALLDRAGLIPEGKWYKGMYRKPTEDELADYVRYRSMRKADILAEVATKERQKKKGEATSSEQTDTSTISPTARRLE